jgi:hypothetical protein
MATISGQAGVAPRIAWVRAHRDNPNLPERFPRTPAFSISCRTTRRRNPFLALFLTCNGEVSRCMVRWWREFARPLPRCITLLLRPANPMVGLSLCFSCVDSGERRRRRSGARWAVQAGGGAPVGVLTAPRMALRATCRGQRPRTKPPAFIWLHKSRTAQPGARAISC